MPVDPLELQFQLLPTCQLKQKGGLAFSSLEQNLHITTSHEIGDKFSRLVEPKTAEIARLTETAAGATQAVDGVKTVLIEGSKEGF